MDARCRRDHWAALTIGMLTVPHTPRWLMEHGREDEAREVLMKLRGTDPHADIEKEIEDVKDAQKKESSTMVRDLLAHGDRLSGLVRDWRFSSSSSASTP